VGRQDEAQANIDTALKLDPKAGQAMPCAPSSMSSATSGSRLSPKPKMALP